MTSRADDHGPDPDALPERVLVCVGPAPASARLVRAACRMATALRAPWIAAYVESPAGSSLGAEDRGRLADHLRLAESLGGEVAVVSGERRAEALLELARRRNVTRIVCGKPTHPRWRDFVYGSLLEDLVRGSGDIDVHVIAGDAEEAATAGAQPARPPFEIGPYVRGAIPVLAAATVSTLAERWLELADVAMVLLVGVAITAAFLGRGPSVFASVLAVGIFDVFFVPPVGTFAVAHFGHVVTFAVMLCAGVLISGLTERIRRQSRAARERERRTAALYSLTRGLAGARDLVEIASIATAQVYDVLESRATLLVPENEGVARLTAAGTSSLELSDADQTVARWAFEHGKPAGRGMQTLPEARVIAEPLLAEGEAVGVLVVVPSPETRFEDPVERHLLATFVTQIALAVDRARLADEAQRSELRAETEEMRSSLLSSVSHDLRSPIATVLGAASTLVDSTIELPQEQREELLVTIRDEAARLGRLVGNLLHMTRVEAGALDVKKEWVPLEELVGAVLHRFEPRLAGRDVVIDVPGSVLAPMDPVLFEQVLVNLFENALKHTPPGARIELRARAEEDTVTVEVADRGPGIAPGNETRIFEKFVRGPTEEPGAGLGLAICKGIVRAHGGTIVAANRAEGGASFRVTLPLEGSPPSMPADGDLAEDAS